MNNIMGRVGGRNVLPVKISPALWERLNNGRLVPTTAFWLQMGRTDGKVLIWTTDPEWFTSADTELESL